MALELVRLCVVKVTDINLTLTFVKVTELKSQRETIQQQTNENNGEERRAVSETDRK